MSGPQTADQLPYVIQLRQDLAGRQERKSEPRRPFSDTISSSLRTGILDGHIPAGTWLNEELLARALGVSRTPVREALRKLDGEQLTVRGPGGSRIVAAPSTEDVVALYRLRECLEGLAARLVAEHPGSAPATLAQITDQMREALAQADAPGLTRLNRKFHSELWAATGNDYLIRFLVEVRSVISRFGRSPFENPEIARRYVEDKVELTHAIAAGLPDDAEAIARRHTVDAQRQRLRLLYTGLLPPRTAPDDAS